MFFVFSGLFWDNANKQMTKIGYMPSKQSDDDMPRTQMTSYLPDPHEDNNSAGKKMAHEMRGVLLVVLIYLLTKANKSILKPN